MNNYEKENLNGDDVDLNQPCDPINVPPPEELKDFKPESVAGENITPEQVTGNEPPYYRPAFVPMHLTDEEIKNDPYFSKIFSKPDLEVKVEEKYKQITECYDDLQQKIFLKPVSNEDQEPSLTKKLQDKFKKLSNTQEFKRTHEISVRIDSNEKQKIEDRSKSFGFKNISDYIRFVAMNSYLMAGVDQFNKTMDTKPPLQQKQDVEVKMILQTDNGGNLYMENGSLKFRSPSGKVTTLADN